MAGTGPRANTKFDLAPSLATAIDQARKMRLFQRFKSVESIGDNSTDPSQELGPDCIMKMSGSGNMPWEAGVGLSCLRGNSVESQCNVLNEVRKAQYSVLV